MLKKLNDLQFVIGLFFTVVSVILLLNEWLSGYGNNLNVYTGTGFLVFGILMIVLRGKQSS